MRLVFKIILIILLLCMVGIGLGYWFIQQQLAKLPITQLNYSISSIGVRHITIEQLQFFYPAHELEVQLDTLSVQIRWPSMFEPRLQNISLSNGRLFWQQSPFNSKQTAEETSQPTLPQDWQIPQWLPEHLSVDELLLDLPCHISRCRYIVHVNLENSSALPDPSAQIRYQLMLTDADTPENKRVSVNGFYDTKHQLPVIDTTVSVEDSLLLHLKQQLTKDTELIAMGDVKVELAPPSTWLLQQLQLWQVEIPDKAIQQFSSPVAINSNWQMHLPAEMPIKAAISQISGSWQLSADLSSPVIIPGLGQLQGKVDASLTLKQGELSQYRLQSALQLLDPQLPGSISQHGVGISKLSINISASEQHRPQLTAVPLAFELSTEGQTHLSMAGNAIINTTPPISGKLHGTTVTLKTKQLAAEQFQLTQLQAKTALSAHWLVDRWQLQLTDFSASAAQPTAEELKATSISLSTDKLSLAGDSEFRRISAKGDIAVDVTDLLYPALKKQSWQWQGTVTGATDKLNAEGKLSNTAGLSLTHQLTYQPERTKATWQMAEIFLLAGNPLKDTLTDWPALLDLQRGKLQASGSADITSDKLVSHNSLQLSGVSGIYDRSIFSGLTASPVVEYQSATLTASADDVVMDELQHGVQLGPVRASASYTAPADNLAAGSLEIRQLSLQAMGGTIQAKPTTLDLSQAQPQQLQLHLQQIDLSKVLQQHPSADLTGNGQISGTIPLIISQQGISVEKGQLAAESPGGKLQYRPDAAKRMAENPGMKVLVEALNDFHYSVLSSDVTYDTNGKLILSLKLQGKNPSLEHGRPINFNINLEEDIPALLTSLQLSSQISDKIKQRIQQRFQQRGKTTPPGDNP